MQVPKIETYKQDCSVYKQDQMQIEVENPETSTTFQQIGAPTPGVQRNCCRKYLGGSEVRSSLTQTVEFDELIFSGESFGRSPKACDL